MKTNKHWFDHLEKVLQSAKLGSSITEVVCDETEDDYMACLFRADDAKVLAALLLTGITVWREGEANAQS